MILKDKKTQPKPQVKPQPKKQEPKPKPQEIPKEIEEDKVLNKIIDDALNEVEELEKEESEVMQVTNNEILKEALGNRSKTQDIKNDLHILRSKENEHFIEVMKELHFIKKKITKTELAVLGAIAGCFYLLGTQHEHIAPYIANLWDVLNLFKSNGGD